MEEGDDDMAALMGFSAFGSKRRSPPPPLLPPPLPLVMPLAQLLPGTELLAAFVANGGDRARVETDAFDVAGLLRAGNRSSERLAVLLRGRAESPVAGEQDATALEQQPQLLPEPSFELLRELQEEKNRFEALDAAVFRRARSAANPYEALGRMRFLNRSALKLVNMDHMFGWTRRRYEDLAEFAFADICGGPGGFSEYLLWRASKHTEFARVRGYGISLRDEVCDWKLPAIPPPPSQDDSTATQSASTASPAETARAPQASFEISYGADGTGDVYKLSNIHHFRDLVLHNHPLGVDLVVADGGFQDARDQASQELVMTRLVIAEVLAMFGVLRAGGNFVCKTFEIVTPAMLQLVWLLHQCFEKIAVIKPITSRPASSERYIVALRRADAIPKEAIIEALEMRLASPKQSPHPLFDGSAIHEDACFLAYMTAVSDRFAEAQIQACRRIHELAAAGRRDKRKRVDIMSYHKCWGLND